MAQAGAGATETVGEVDDCRVPGEPVQPALSTYTGAFNAAETGVRVSAAVSTAGKCADLQLLRCYV